MLRLWCVFELAAYKKVNPGGKITFRPLFIERTVCVMLASAYCFAALFLIARDVFGPGITTLAVAFAIFACPYAAGIYLLRMSFREKHQLISQLANFDLEEVHCAEQFDRPSEAKPRFCSVRLCVFLIFLRGFRALGYYGRSEVGYLAGMGVCSGFSIARGGLVTSSCRAGGFYYPANVQIARPRSLSARSLNRKP